MVLVGEERERERGKKVFFFFFSASASTTTFTAAAAAATTPTASDHEHRFLFFSFLNIHFFVKQIFPLFRCFGFFFQEEREKIFGIFFVLFFINLQL